MLIFFESLINSKDTHIFFKKNMEVVLTFMTSRYVIQPSKILKKTFSINNFRPFSSFRMMSVFFSFEIHKPDYNTH